MKKKRLVLACKVAGLLACSLLVLAPTAASGKNSSETKANSNQIAGAPDSVKATEMIVTPDGHISLSDGNALRMDSFTLKLKWGSQNSAPSGLSATPAHKVRMVLHAGAGVVSQKQMTAHHARQILDCLRQAVVAGAHVLDTGTGEDAPVNAVVASINVLENSGLFDAGKGAVFDHDGHHQCDASIMDGGLKTEKNTGAVACVASVKNPITAARAVLQKSRHVMFVGAGAEQFAKQMNLDVITPDYYDSEDAKREYEEFQQDEKAMGLQRAVSRLDRPDRRMSTVGCVVRTGTGHLVAGTSTGGLTGKLFMRVGDSPIIGAGTWADGTSGISCTGDGEYFIARGVAHEINSRMRLLGESPTTASLEVFNDLGRMHRTDGKPVEGGAIVLDKDGKAAMIFNPGGMYRAVLFDDGTIEAAIY